MKQFARRKSVHTEGSQERGYLFAYFFQHHFPAFFGRKPVVCGLGGTDIRLTPPQDAELVRKTISVGGAYQENMSLRLLLAYLLTM